MLSIAIERGMNRDGGARAINPCFEMWLVECPPVRATEVRIAWRIRKYYNFLGLTV